MTDVRKRNGTAQLFDAAKIRKAVVKAVVEAGGDPDESKKSTIDPIVEKAVLEAHEKDEVPSSAIRRVALEELDKKDPRAADAWRDFDATYKAIEAPRGKTTIPTNTNPTRYQR